MSAPGKRSRPTTRNDRPANSFECEEKLTPAREKLKRISQNLRARHAVSGASYYLRLADVLEAAALK